MYHWHGGFALHRRAHVAALAAVTFHAAVHEEDANGVVVDDDDAGGCTDPESFPHNHWFAKTVAMVTVKIKLRMSSSCPALSHLYAP